MRTSLLRSSVMVLVVMGFQGAALGAQKSNPFQGAKVNHGYVTHEVVNGKNVLTLSADFVPPETPDPHWRVVDSKGNVYLLERLKTKSGMKGDKKDVLETSITLPDYIPDVAKVQMWCAWAETVLGEATFEQPVMSMNR